MANTTQLALTELTPGQANAEVTVNDALRILDAAVQLGVKDRDLATPPGSPTTGDRYIVAASGTGAWSGHDGKLAVYLNGAWVIRTPKEGWRCWIDDEDVLVVYDGSDWVEREGKSITTGITASGTHTQGQVPLTSVLNIIATCAVADDTVTLPAAAKGRRCVIVNQGIARAQVFPASGDAIENGAVDAATTVAAGSRKDFVAVDGTTWYQV
jgi:hypothetical protein